MKKLRTFVTLQPHGNNLMSNQTHRWIISIGLIILLMSFSEGFIWANMFNFYFEERLSILPRMLFCCSIGFIVLCIIWVIDSSFVMLDTSSPPKEIESQDKKWWKLDKSKRNIYVGFIGRLILISISLYVTIPAVTKLSMQDDINKVIDSRNQMKIDTLRSKISELYDKKIEYVESQKNDKDQKLVGELGGKGISGRYGDDVVAKEIRNQRDSCQNEKNKLILQKEAEIKEINNAKMSDLEKKYGVVFYSKTSGLIEEIAGEMSKNENYREIEKISRVYVILLFCGVILLKIFSPRSVKIYLNEELQDFFELYLRGQINVRYMSDLQDFVHDVSVKTITPYVFEEFWNKYLIRKNNYESSFRNDESFQKVEGKISKLNFQKDIIEREIELDRVRYIEVSNKLLEFEKELIRLTYQIQSQQEKINNIENRIKSVKDNTDEIMAEDLVQLSKQMKVMITDRDDLLNKYKEIECNIQIKSKEKLMIEKDLVRLEKDRELLLQNIESINTLKNNLRNKYFEVIKNN